MDLTYIIIAALILALPAFLTRLGGTRDTDKVLGADLRSRPAGVVAKKPAGPAIGNLPAAQPRRKGLIGTIRHAQGMGDKVRRLAKNGQKIEAIKLLREETGMGLEQATDLVNRL